MSLIVDFPSQHHHLNHDSTVRFDIDIEIKFVDNLAIEHKDELWYSREELKASRPRQARAMLQMKSNNTTMAQYAMLNINDTSSFLGLENYLTESVIPEIMLRRRMHIEGVLGEHHRQIHDGIQDHDQLSSISQERSKWARNRARIVALIHAP